MQYVDHFLGFDFLPVASNDNDDLLDICSPNVNLSHIRSVKKEMRDENARSGTLLRSRKRRKFFQEITDAEYYITLKYFSPRADQRVMHKLRRYILDHYLFPKTL